MSSSENDTKIEDWEVQYYNDAGYASGKPIKLRNMTEKQANDACRAKLNDWSLDHYALKRIPKV